MKLKLLLLSFVLIFATPAEARHYHHRHIHYSSSYDRGTIVDHPSGCPRSLFCGCGASVRIFGHPVRDLFLAAAWLKFHRTNPAPGMVAARSGHVFVLENQNSDGTWQVYDANSGGGRTRIHSRSLAGYTIVDPHSG